MMHNSILLYTAVSRTYIESLSSSYSETAQYPNEQLQSTQETQTFAEIISSLIPVNLILFD